MNAAEFADTNLGLLPQCFSSYPFGLPDAVYTAKTMAVPTSSTTYFVALAFHLILKISQGLRGVIPGANMPVQTSVLGQAFRQQHFSYPYWTDLLSHRQSHLLELPMHT